MMRDSAYCSKIANAGQRGATAVEFAVVAMLFFTLLFGITEFGRIMFLWNTVQEVTRRAAREATVTNFSDTAAMNAVKQSALFGADQLIFGGGIDATYIRIEYLNHSLDPVSTLTTCPTKNIEACLTDPKGAGCIRFVRASLCQPGGGACTQVPYTPMIGLFTPLFTDANNNPTVVIPSSPVVMPAESLGFRPSIGTC